ncbi:MAG TPA: response regulator [Reyranella sp.]
MVVEDEILVRAATARYLREAGCIVFEAVSAEECLDLLASDRSIDVVFADIRLPQQSGLDLVRTLKQTHPHLGLVLTTGAKLDEPLPDGVALLQKPYGLFEIERRIAVLRNRRNPGANRNSPIGTNPSPPTKPSRP